MKSPKKKYILKPQKQTFLDIVRRLKKEPIEFSEFLDLLKNISDKFIEDLKTSLAELSQTMEQFHKASTSINTILDDNKTQINGVVTNMNKVSSDFSKISDSLSKADLGKTAKNLQETLAKVDKMMTDIQAGKGTAGKLINDEELYNNLAKTSKELELLLEDVRLHPTRYVNVSVFGKKNKPYVAPVKDTIKK